MLCVVFLDFVEPAFNLVDLVFGVRENKLADGLEVDDIGQIELKSGAVYVAGEHISFHQRILADIAEIVVQLDAFENDALVLGARNIFHKNAHYPAPFIIITPAQNCNGKTAKFDLTRQDAPIACKHILILP